MQKPVGYRGKKSIADNMALHIVDMLEPVDVKDDKGSKEVGIGLSEMPRRKLGEVAARRQSRQRIVAHQMQDLFFGCHARADIFEQHDDATVGAVAEREFEIDGFL